MRGYAWPKLRTASATEFFKTMEQNPVEVIRGAWPDWWTDGFGASAREVAATRYAQGDLIAATGGLSMAALSGVSLPVDINHRIDAANNALLFYTEHTVGYHGSIREPFHRYTMEQRAMKESYAWEARRRAGMLGEEALGLLQSLLSRNTEPSMVVYNTLSWSRSGMLKVYIDHQVIPRNARFTMTDAKGNLAKAQPLEHHSDGTYWAVWVDDVPPFGLKRYAITVIDRDIGMMRGPHSGKAISELSNQWYSLRVDTNCGAILSLFDKELKQELFDPEAVYPAGSFIYEQLDNREQLEAFHLSNFTRSLPDSVWFDGIERGAVWDEIRFKSNTHAASRDGTLVIVYRLYHVTKRLELLYEIEKKGVVSPEAIYIALPWMLDDGALFFDVQGGEMQAGVDQIPGSSNDWNTVQNYARLASPRAQIVVASQEAPLMQFGGINTGRFTAGAGPETSHVYGWPMNNYWTTNFNADQRGGHVWSYVLTSYPSHEMVDALRFGWGVRIPFVARGVARRWFRKSA
jgi:alpha-mannosidase